MRPPQLSNQRDGGRHSVARRHVPRTSRAREWIAPERARPASHAVAVGPPLTPARAQQPVAKINTAEPTEGRGAEWQTDGAIDTLASGRAPFLPAPARLIVAAQVQVGLHGSGARTRAAPGPAARASRESAARPRSPPSTMGTSRFRRLRRTAWGHSLRPPT